MNQQIATVLKDEESGFYSKTQAGFEAWLKELLKDDYKPPSTTNFKIVWDGFWFNEEKKAF